MRGRCGEAAREHRFPGTSFIDGYSNGLGSCHFPPVHRFIGAGVHKCIRARLQDFGCPVNCTAANVQLWSASLVRCCSYAHLALGSRDQTHRCSRARQNNCSSARLHGTAGCSRFRAPPPCLLPSRPRCYCSRRLSSPYRATLCNISLMHLRTCAQLHSWLTVFQRDTYACGSRFPPPTTVP